MGRPTPSSAGENELKKGPWTPEEDEKLSEFINKHGYGSWRALPRLAGLKRCGKSCRLRWMNYLRPDIKRGSFSEEEERLIVHLHSTVGNKWSQIAAHLPGRTDNEIKNFWNTHMRKKLIQKGIDPKTHKPIPKTNHITNDLLMSLIIAQSIGGPGNNNNNNLGSLLVSNPWEIMATELAKIQVVQNLIQLLGTNIQIADRSVNNNTLLGLYDINTTIPSSETKDISNIPGVNPNAIDLHRAMNLQPAISEPHDVISGNSKLPAMWPTSSEGSTEHTPKMSCGSSFSTKSNAPMSIFEDLEKLMEDDTCASFLSDFLQE